MLVKKEDISSVIPQRSPIVMVDNLLEQTEYTAVTDFVISEQNIFVRDGEFQESGIIENIAQTAAAGTGYYYRQNEIAQPLLFIGAINRLRVNKSAVVGNQLRTKTEIITTMLNITLVKGSCYVNDELIAECEMKIVTDQPIS